MKHLLEKNLIKTLKKLGFDCEVELEYPREKSNGDYTTTIALKLAKIKQKNPLEIAKIIQKNLSPQPFLDHTEVILPGFINFYLSSEYLENKLQKNLKSENYGKMAYGKGKKIIIEYSSPNIAKPLGAHHLLSTLIGQTLANILDYCGYKVVKLNYLGDWGTQFGKLIYAYKIWGKHKAIEKDPMNELLMLYIRFHSEAENNPDLEEKARRELKKLEEGDKENMRIWSLIREKSIKALEKIYDQLDVHFDEYLSESLYNKIAGEIIKNGKALGVFKVGEKGALIVEFENDQYPPFLVQKADGATLYSIRDIASLEERLARYKPEKILYVVDVAQSLHFKQLFATVRRLGFDKAELIHVVFGRMRLPEKKMSTREGTMVLLDELLEEARSRARKIIEQKSAELPASEKKVITEGVAIGAIKYHIISQNRETDLIFDWDRMLSLEGNSAPYLQYSYARAESILRKAKTAGKKNEEKKISKKENGIKNPNRLIEENDLIHAMMKFPEYIRLAAESYKPNILTNYLYEFAKLFNSFYQKVPVLDAPTPELKNARLNLVKSFTRVMKKGLDLLGINTFERM